MAGIVPRGASGFGARQPVRLHASPSTVKQRAPKGPRMVLLTASPGEVVAVAHRLAGGRGSCPGAVVEVEAVSAGTAA